jgi:Holliday junction resolvase RusA-like endonuclease
MHLDFFMPDKRRRDPNNLLKGIADALEGIVYTDDKQITKLSWENMGVDRAQPRVEISYGAHGDE